MIAYISGALCARTVRFFVSNARWRFFFTLARTAVPIARVASRALPNVAVLHRSTAACSSAARVPYIICARRPPYLHNIIVLRRVFARRCPMHGPSSTVACALWLACVALLLAAEAAAPGARRHERRVRTRLTAAAGRSTDNAASAAMGADDYDRDNYDEDYEDSGDVHKQPPPPPPPPPPPTTSASVTLDHRTIFLSYYNNILVMCIWYSKKCHGRFSKRHKTSTFTVENSFNTIPIP